MFGKNFGYLSVFALVSVLILFPMVSATLDVSLSDQGTGVRNKTSGELLASGNLSVLIYDSMAGGNLVYEENFTDSIFNGSWNVMLGENSSNPLSLEYGKKYYKDYLINGEDASFQNLTGHTVDRQFFHSPLGDIADEDINDSTNLTIGERITFALGEFIDNMVNGWLRITGSLNVTGNMRVEDAGQAIFFVNASSGRVGIGTDDPGGKLHVVGDEGTGMLGDPDPTGIILIGGAGNDGMSGKDGADISITGGSGGIGGVDPGGLGGDVIINPGSGGEGSPAGSDGNVVLAATAGKVGIGISTPSDKLHVNGSLNVTGNISTPELCLNGDCQTSWPAGGPGGGWTNTTNDTYTYKNVGIGTTSPNATLDVNGSVYFWGGSGDVDGSGIITIGDRGDILSYLGGSQNLSSAEYARADVNGDGRVDWDDAYIVLALRDNWDFYSEGYIYEKKEAIRNISNLYGSSPSDSETFYVNGKLGVGISNPASELELVGTMKVKDPDDNIIMLINSTGNSSMIIDPVDKWFSTLIINSSTYIRGGSGDSNGDGFITSTDKNEYIQGYIQGTANLTEEEFARSDINGDGRVDWSDLNLWTELNGLWYPETDSYRIKRMEGIRNISATYGVREMGSFYVNGKLGVGDYTPESELEVVGGGMFSTVSGGDGDLFIINSSTGYVGVGTNNPSERLNVNGSVIIEDASGNRLMVLNASDNDTLIINPSDKGFGIVYINSSTYIRGGTGDVNGNGEIQNTDENLYYNLYLSESKMLTEEEFARADVNGDGRVDWDDYGIQDKLSGLHVGGADFWEKVKNYTRNVSATYGVREMGSFYVNGKLGVGDYTPDSELEVVGGGMFSSAAGQNGDLFIINSSTGYVGIGTNSPNATLDVNGSVIIEDASGNIIMLINSTENSSMSIDPANKWFSTLIINSSTYIRGGSGDVNLLGGISATDTLIIGNYLEGSTNLTEEEFARADVNGDGKVSRDDLYIVSQLAGHDYPGTLSYESERYDLIRNVSSIYGVGSLGSFYVKGKLGVGDSTPDSELEVVGGGMFSSAAGQNGDLFIINSSTGYVGVGTNNPSEELHVNGSVIVEDSGGQAVFFVNSSSGKIGIGTSGPATSFDVINKTLHIGNGDGLSYDYDSIVIGDSNDVSYNGLGLFNANDRAWLNNRKKAIYSLNGLRTDGEIYMLGNLSIEYGSAGIGDTVPEFKVEIANTSGKGYLGISSSPDNDGDILIVNENGSVGIGTTNPKAKLHIIDGALLLNGTTGSTPVSGAGTRMMWIPAKGAFRAGQVTSTKWDDANIGNDSFASGYETTASGDYSSAMGYFSNATGDYATAIGDSSTAEGYGSVAIGRATSSGTYSTALGALTEASGYGSTSMGRETTASGDYATAIGREIEASGEYSFAIALNDQNGANLTQSNTMAIMGGKVGIGTFSPNSTLTVAGNITPSANDTYSLGGPELWWKDLYVGSNSLYIGGIPLHEEEGVLKWGGKDISGLPEQTQEKATGGDFVLPEGIETIDANEICLNGDCRSFWPEGSGGQEGRIEATEICLNGECHTEWPELEEREPIFDLTGGFIGTTLGRFLLMGQTGYSLSLGADGIMDMIFVSEEGRVGIGTSMPSARLDVNGSINATGTICDGEGNCLDSVSLEITPCIEDGDWYVEGEDMHSGVEGNVGIGTDEPSAKLHVNDTMKLEPRDEPPECSELGMLYVDRSGALCFCDGSVWSVAAGSGTCGQAEEGPAG